MGSLSTLLRQAAVLAALCAVLAWLAPTDAKLWVVAMGLVSLGLFCGISLYRHRQIMRLAAEIDEVLHGGRRVDFSTCREGDVAILTSELAKMVARLGRTRDQLSHERNALADALADVSHQIRTPLTAIGLMLPLIERTDDGRERRRLVRELEGMLDQVSWLVTTLLKIAKVDAGAMHVERREVLAGEVARRAVGPLATAMDLRDVNLVLDLDEAATFVGDAPWSAEDLQGAHSCRWHRDRDRTGGRPGYHLGGERHGPRYRGGGSAPHLRALLPRSRRGGSGCGRFKERERPSGRGRQQGRRRCRSAPVRGCGCCR